MATVDKSGLVVSDASVQTLIYTNNMVVVVDESSVLQAAISRIEQQTERLEMQAGGGGLTLGGGDAGLRLSSISEADVHLSSTAASSELKHQQHAGEQELESELVDEGKIRVVETSFESEQA
jgi:hypothetical protein